MEKYFELKNALEYIEDHIREGCTQEEIARAACVSLSSLQKLFRYAFGHGVNEHINKRRMTLAAGELLAGPISVAELAREFGYSTTESFSRAFRKVNCCLPSDYRRGPNRFLLRPYSAIAAWSGRLPPSWRRCAAQKIALWCALTSWG